jgi:DNA primase small subunit
MRKTLRGKWPSQDNESIRSADLWDQYKAEYKKFRTDSQDGQKRKNDLSIESLVMCYLYPRLDANVSTSINHLLKSPWCVHPKTGK